MADDKQQGTNFGDMLMRMVQGFAAGYSGRWDLHPNAMDERRRKYEMEMEQFKEQQKVNKATLTLKEAQLKAQQAEQERLLKPAGDWLKPETKPESQFAPEGPQAAPGEAQTYDKPTGKLDFMIPPGATVGDIEQTGPKMKGIMELLRPKRETEKLSEGQTLIDKATGNIIFQLPKGKKYKQEITYDDEGNQTVTYIPEEPPASKQVDIGTTPSGQRETIDIPPKFDVFQTGVKRGDKDSWTLQTEKRETATAKEFRRVWVSKKTKEVQEGPWISELDKSIKNKEDVDKMYAQYLIAKVKGETSLLQIMMGSILKDQGITAPTPEKWPDLTREEFGLYITTGKLPTKKEETKKPKVSEGRQRAIDTLKTAGYPETEDNIKALMESQGWK